LRDGIPRHLRPLMGRWIFGCDECQEVCPFNAGVLGGLAANAPRAARAALPAGGMARHEPFEPSEAMRTAEVAELLTDEGRGSLMVPGSPLLRARATGMARNAAIALGNRGETKALPGLRRLAAEDPSSPAGEAAAWAVVQMEVPKPGASAVAARLTRGR